MDKDDEHKQSPRKRSGRKTSPRASAGKPRKASAGKTARTSASKRNSAGTDASAKQSAASRIRRAADPRLSRSLEYGVAIIESFSGGRQTLGIAHLADL